MTELNVEHWWQPFTNTRAFQVNPRIFTRAEGCFLYQEDGHEVLDIGAGLWSCNFGHGRKTVADAVHTQLMQGVKPALYHETRGIMVLISEGLLYRGWFITVKAFLFWKRSTSCLVC